MNPQDITTLMESIVKLVGPSAQYVFELAVRQSIFYGISDLIFGVLFLLLAFVLWRRKTLRNFEEDNVYRNDLEIVVAILWGMFAISAVLAALLIFQGSWRLFNPEYTALQDLIDLIQ